MLELIDQSDAERLVFRCLSCGEEGLSSLSFAKDGYFWDGSGRPGRWVLHQCAPVPTEASEAEAVKPKRGRPPKPTVS